MLATMLCNFFAKAAGYAHFFVTLHDYSEADVLCDPQIYLDYTLYSNKHDAMMTSCLYFLQVDCPVVMTSSVSGLLQNCPRLSPHFTFAPITHQEEGGVVALTPPLADFVRIDPFEVTSKSVELAPPKSLSADKGSDSDCCGGPPEAKRACCGSGTCPENT